MERRARDGSGDGVAGRAAGGLRAAALALLVPLAAAAGCDGGSSDSPPIDREAFVEVMVDLRDTTQIMGWEIDEGAREHVLERHGVTEDDLLGFARARGDDPAAMREVWAEVEERLEARIDERRGAPEREAGAEGGPPEDAGGEG